MINCKFNICYNVLNKVEQHLFNYNIDVQTIEKQQALSELMYRTLTCEEMKKDDNSIFSSKRGMKKSSKFFSVWYLKIME